MWALGQCFLTTRPACKNVAMSDAVALSGKTLSERTAEEIRALLGRRRMSESALARAMGVSQAYIWRRLSGEIPMDLNDLEKVSRALTVPLSALLPELRTAGRVTERDSARPVGYPASRTRPGGPRRPVRISGPLAA